MGAHLSEAALEAKGFLPTGCLANLRQPVREAVAGVVVRPGDVRVADPLLGPAHTPQPTSASSGSCSPARPRCVPDVDDGDAGVADHGHELRRRHVRHALPRHRLRPPWGAGSGPRRR